MDRRKDTWYTLLVGSLLAAVTQAAFWPVIHCAFLNYDGPDVQVRNGPRAVELAERACQLTEWKTAFFLGTLAAAYAEAGQFADAAATAERARTGPSRTSWRRSRSGTGSCSNSTAPESHFMRTSRP